MQSSKPFQHDAKENNQGDDYADGIAFVSSVRDVSAASEAWTLRPARLGEHDLVWSPLP